MIGRKMKERVTTKKMDEAEARLGGEDKEVLGEGCTGE